MEKSFDPLLRLILFSLFCLLMLARTRLEGIRQYQTSIGVFIWRLPFARLLRENQQTQSRNAYLFQANGMPS